MGIYFGYTARILFFLVVVFNLSACSYFKIFKDKGGDYLEAESVAPTIVPGELDSPPFHDLMPIPGIVDSRGISGQEFELTVPAPLSSTYGVDQVVIRKLGEKHWIFLDAPTAMLWPKLREFWVNNNLDIEAEDPGRGWLETEWLVSRSGNPDQIYTSLISGRAQSDSRAAIENKFRMQIEPGVRQGSTEVRIQYLQLTKGDENKSNISWSSAMVNAPEIIGVEEKVLTQLAQYLGQTINTRSSVSLLAGTMSGKQRIVLTPDRVKPVLSYFLEYERAWSTVAGAVDTAGITIEEENRENSIMSVVYEDKSQKKPGFIARIFNRSGGSKAERERYLLKIQQVEDRVEVTVFKNESELADAGIAERLLKIIKEYST